MMKKTQEDGPERFTTGRVVSDGVLKRERRRSPMGSRTMSVKFDGFTYNNTPLPLFLWGEGVQFKQSLHVFDSRSTESESVTNHLVVNIISEKKLKGGSGGVSIRVYFKPVSNSKPLCQKYCIVNRKDG